MGSRIDWNGKGQGHDGDKTTTGAICQGNYQSFIEEGKMLLREGDKTTACPVCKQIGVLIDGTDEVILDGKKAILDGSLVHCGCPPGTNRVVAPLVPGASIPHENLGYHPAKEEPVQPKATSNPIMPVKPKREAVDAGFCVVHLPASVSDYGNWLLMNAPEGTRAIYDQLNGEGLIKTGSILLLVDPEKQDPQQIKHLQDAKKRIDTALAPLSDQQANFLHKHKHFIDMFTAISSPIMGKASEAAKQYLEKIEDGLKELSELYKTTYASHGKLVGEHFYKERQYLLTKLDNWMYKFTRHKLELQEYDSMKKALGLSTKSIVHKWNQTGLGDIEGYATYLENAAKYIKLMEKAGLVALGLDVAGDADKIYEACTTGKECKKTTFTTVGEFGGGLVGGARVGKFVAPPIADATCALAMGVLTWEAGGAGELWCPIIVKTAVVIGGEYATGKLGEELGDDVSEFTDFLFDK